MYEECPLPGEAKDSKRKKLVAIGYSFPSNDFRIRKVVRGLEGELIIVNASGDSDCYKEGLNQDWPVDIQRVQRPRAIFVEEG